MAHHIPTQIELYSLWSMNRMRAPPATTTARVAATITPIAPRTDGGSRRNRFSLRSTRFSLGMSLPPLFQILPDASARQPNWLPAPPGPFNLTMHLYAAQIVPILSGTYRLPAVRRLSYAHPARR